MFDKKWSLIACISYMIGELVIACIMVLHSLKNITIFNTIVTILHVPFIIIMIICTIKSFQDYKKEKDEINKE
jgi:uncharacterized membrane protein YkvI